VIVTSRFLEAGLLNKTHSIYPGVSNLAWFVLLQIWHHLFGRDFSLCEMARGGRFLGMELVDILHIPLERRLQTVAVCCYLFLYLCFTVFCGVTAVWLWFTRLYFIPLLYAVWYIYDFRTPERGGRRCEWIRNWRIWHYCREYFPMTLKSTSTLDSNRNYLFIYHPHGIIASGVCINFGTNATGFQKLFPGLRCSIAALNLQFVFPFCREYILSLGEQTVQ